MRRYLLLVSVSTVIAGSACAQSVDRAWQVDNKKGVPVAVRTYSDTMPDCSSGPMPTITVDHPPSKGSVTTRIESKTVSPLRAKRCVGVEITGITVLYTPNQGFRGKDSFSYLVTFTDDPRQFHDTAQITVY